MIYDLIVIGLGPAGSSACYFGAKQGLKVLGFDKAAFPRHKLCGGAISTRIDEVLDFDLSTVIRQRADTGILDFDGDRLRFALGKPFVYLVERPEFDAFLLQKADKAGAVIRLQEAYLSHEENEDFVEVRTDHGVYRSRYLLGCDGALGKVGRQLNPSDIEQKGFGLEAEIPPESAPSFISRGSVLIRFNEVAWGYGWIFPKEKSASAGLVRFSGKWKGAKEAYLRFLAHYQLEASSRGHPLPVYSSALELCRAKGRVGLAGDAAFLADDFLGEGIYFSVKSGKLAARSVSSSLQGEDFESLYLKGLGEEIFADLETSRKLAEGIYSLPLLTYWVIKFNPRLFLDYLESLTRESGYRDFYRENLPQWLQKGLKIVYNFKKKS